MCCLVRARDGDCGARETTADGETSAGREATEGEVYSTETVNDDSSGQGQSSLSSLVMSDWVKPSFVIFDIRAL